MKKEIKTDNVLKNNDVSLDVPKYFIFLKLESET